MTENTSDDSHIASRADLTGSSHLDNESERQAADLRHGIVIVSNDASRTGAPLTALNIAREFVARGIPVVTILLLAGDLEPEFARVGPVFVMRQDLVPTYHLETRRWARLIKRAIFAMESAWHGDEERFWGGILRYLEQRRIRHALCNTVLSGGASVRLKDAGVASIGLIHEMPHSIRTHGWTDQASTLIQGVDGLVFACPEGRDAFAGAFSIGGKPGFVLPQSYNTNPDQLTAEPRAAARSAFRARLGLCSDDILILSCGYGDFRKGVDLFVQAAREMASSAVASPIGQIVFAWAGQVNAHFQDWAEKDVIALGLEDHLIFLGFQQDMAPVFAVTDIFFLPSREDPFPTVVLEAMASGLPVVGFAGSGGIEEQLRGGAGVVVPYADVASAVTRMRWLSGQPEERNRMGRIGQAKVARAGGYHEYVGNLIDALLPRERTGA
jgi:glycosyltransferase involved in cell wall biosynthesis